MRYHQRRSDYLNAFKAIVACIMVFCLVVLVMAAKVSAYGGDTDCLFVHCVKVKR